MADLDHVVIRPFSFAGADFKAGDLVDPKDLSALQGARPDLLRRYCRAAGVPLRPVTSTPAASSSPARALEN